MFVSGGPVVLSCIWPGGYRADHLHSEVIYILRRSVSETMQMPQCHAN